MGCRVHKPGGVQAERNAQQHSPQHHGDAVHPTTPDPSASKQQKTTGGDRKPVVLAEPNVESVAGQVRRIALENLGLRMQGFTEEYPTGVSPPSTFARSVGVAFVVADLMMYTVRRDPEDRPTLKREGGEDTHQVFNPFGGLVSAVGQQPVIAHAYSDIN